MRKMGRWRERKREREASMKKERNRWNFID